jgi:hypothetical protein
VSNERDLHAGGSASAAEEAPVASTPEIEAMLARARRILGGDVRPDDYLPVTPEIRAAADFEMAYVRGHMKIEPLPEVVARQLRDWILSFHHAGQDIAFISNEKGVVVLADGDRIGDLIDGASEDQLRQVIFTIPEPF